MGTNSLFSLKVTRASCVSLIFSRLTVSQGSSQCIIPSLTHFSDFCST